MINRKERKKFKGERKDNTLRSLRLFFILLLFCFVNCKAISPKDSIKHRYALNDPRNPECPCHKYQKMAEDEFNKSLKGSHPTNISKEGVTTKGMNSHLKKYPNKYLLKFIFHPFNSTNKRRAKSRKIKRAIDRCYIF